MSEKYNLIYTLKTPINFEGEEVTEILIDLEPLKAKDLKKAEAIFRASGEQAPLMELSKTYNIIIAHLASGQPLEFFDELSARDYQQIHMKVANFLNA